MTSLLEISASWAIWLRTAPAGVLPSITHVQFTPSNSGYHVHISAWDVSGQEEVAALAEAIGADVDEGWEPKNAARSQTKRQWSLGAVRDGLDWHITATQDWAPGEREDPVPPPSRDQISVRLELPADRAAIDEVFGE